MPADLPPFGLANEATRAAWLEQALRQLPNGARLLDAGAGELKYKKFCAHLKYVSQDFAQYNGQGDNRGLQTGTWDQTRLDIVSDITSIPEPDQSFDAILCVEVLEHLPNPSLAIREFSRLMRPGGQLILTAPFCSLTHFAPYHFSTGFNRYFYEHHLPAAGFKVVEMTPNGNFFEYLAQELRRVPQVARDQAQSNLSWLDRAACYGAVKMLQRFSRKDRGSSDLLNFGFHVRALKE